MSNPRSLLDQYKLNPIKSLGQNFLHDPNALEKIVTIAELMPEDTVVEIGPGTGALTTRLAQAARHVISIEVDERLRPILEKELQPYDNVDLVFEDILKVDVAKLVGMESFVVVANVPYYITSAILRHLLEAPHRPRRLVLTIQTEVAERIIAKPDDMSLLAISVQFYGKPQIMARLNPAVFWPRPEVDSAVLRIDTYDKPPVDAPNDTAFFQVVRAGFSQKRKQIKNAISGGLRLKASEAESLLLAANLDPKRRAETLSLEEWAALSRTCVASGVCKK